jgi:murein DD-endopeptidase MepM/ murein hydrolase activator NlpD
VSARKERDRYRGRRRIPTPPRSRYAAVATTALIGAGVVAMATAASMPDMKTGGDPATHTAVTSSNSSALMRQAIVDRANRSTNRTSTPSESASLDVWLLPMGNYTIAKPYGDATALSKGVDLSAAEGTPFYAAHGGRVILARWNGGYGYTVIIDVGNGVQLVYGHASKLLVQEGQTVNSGDLLALTGNTGYSFGPNVHFEVRVNGVATDPVAYLSDHGVDLVHKKDSLS